MRIEEKILKIASIGLLALSAIFAVLFFLDAVGPECLLIWTYVLAGIAVFSLLTFFVVSLVVKPKEAKGSLIGFGALILVFAIAFFTASSDIPQFLGSEKFEITNFESQLIGGTLSAVYILFSLAVLGIIYTEGIAKFVRK